eukprot:TRINITY_DN4796_c0_g2_i1.p1 TRINITY_DN4796_c0_g2~~TRINITY_DN4796_c0_g2_i1.p1  ORF type:complete len:392 (+),score=126.60 TRINITY_DN4796_c0_g2_i1:52-1176(+)
MATSDAEWAPRYVPGASGEQELDAGCGVKKYRWTFDGKDFDWECYDHGEWFPLLGKKKFQQVLQMMAGEDGHPWGKASEAKGYPYPIKVSGRSPTIAGAKTNEMMVEGIIPGVTPEQFFNTLNESEYRATWDSSMKKGYNIARFSSNNDIGYYEATMPMITNRDFCNQRAWAELGGEEYMICNHSNPHPRCPVKKGVVRAWSFITAYHLRPIDAEAPSAGTVVTYMACPDAGGWVPKTVLNMIQSKVGPTSMTNLAKAAAGLDAWLEEVHKAHQAAGAAKPYPGRWDETMDAPGAFFPRDPAAKGAYRTAPRPLDREEREVEALVGECDAATVVLRAEEASAFDALAARGTLSQKAGEVHLDPLSEVVTSEAAA